MLGHLRPELNTHHGERVRVEVEEMSDEWSEADYMEVDDWGTEGLLDFYDDLPVEEWEEEPTCNET
jgi:hypothetical protein